MEGKDQICGDIKGLKINLSIKKENLIGGKISFITPATANGRNKFNKKHVGFNILNL